MSTVRLVKTPFDCHICDYGYVHIIEYNGKFYCECSKCYNRTKKQLNPFDAVNEYKEITRGKHDKSSNNKTIK